MYRNPYPLDRKILLLLLCYGPFGVRATEPSAERDRGKARPPAREMGGL
jgi:hypothetical protein